MRVWLIKRLISALAGTLKLKVHSDFDLTQSAEALYGEGVVMMATGFVFPDNEQAAGLYLVRYRSTNQENRYGRYN